MIKEIKQELEEIKKKYGWKRMSNKRWYNISGYQNLSEFFIREFKDKVWWGYISEHQDLSSIFVHKFRGYVWEGILIKRGIVTQEYLHYMSGGVKHNELLRYKFMDLDE